MRVVPNPPIIPVLKIVQRSLWMLISAQVSLLGAHEPISVQTATTAVRLHPDEAWVTRSGVAQIPFAGVHRIAISRLPAGLKLEDIRITAHGPAGIRIGELTVRQSPQIFQEWEEWKHLVAEERRIEKAISYLAQKREVLATSKQFTQELTVTRTKTIQRLMGSETLNTQMILDLSDFIETRHLELGRQEARLIEESANLNMLQDQTKKAQERIQAEASANSTIVLAELETPGAGAVTLSLAFRTTQAVWHPTYEARLSSDRSRLEFVLFAAVKQETNETWAGIEMELVNQNSNENLDLPAVAVLPALNYREEKPSKASSQVPVQPLRTASFSVLRIPGKVEVRRGEEQRFRLTSLDLSPRFQYLAMPRQSHDVNLVALVVPPAQFPLVDGSSIDLLQGSERLGTLDLKVPAPGEPLHLSFGAVPGLSSRHEVIERSHAEIGDKNKEREWLTRERFELENTLTSTVEVEVQDREISSGTDSVKVDQTTGTTSGWSSSRPGLRSWTLQLEPSTKAALELRTRIRGPLVGRLVNLGDLVLEGN
jgi:hypothetical protein